MAICRRIKLDHYLMPHIKINSKWIKCKTEHKTETIRLLEENVSCELLDIGVGDDFLE